MIIYYTDKYEGGTEASRSLLREALAVHTGDSGLAGELISAIRKGEHGKPYIDGFSCFSVSHTGNIWAVLIDGRDCGLDIQLAKTVNTASLADRWFAPEDARIISDLGRTDEAAAAQEFFRLWTRREALVKALGGSVYESGLPAVSGGEAVIGGKSFEIMNIDFPVVSGQCGSLYAAICAEGGSDPSDIEFRAL